MDNREGLRASQARSDQLRAVEEAADCALAERLLTHLRQWHADRLEGLSEDIRH